MVELRELEESARFSTVKCLNRADLVVIACTERFVEVRFDCSCG